MNVEAEYGITKREHDHAEWWKDQLSISFDLDKDTFQLMKEWREYARGVSAEDIGGISEPDLTEDQVDMSEKARPNMIHARLVTINSRIVARNPQVSVTPSEKVDETMYTALRPFTKTCEILLNHEFKTGNIKKELKKQVRAAEECSTGWIKAFFQKDYWTDPLVQWRNDDAQDNIARLQAKIETFESGELELSPEQQNKIMEDIRHLKEGIEEEIEIEIDRGFVFAKVHSDDVRVDPSVDELCDYHRGDWIAHRSFIDIEDAQAMYGLTDEISLKRLRTAKLYNTKEEKEEDTTSSADISKHVDPQNPKASKLKGDVAIWEIQCKKDRLIYTVIEGMKGFAKPPWRPKMTSRHWYDLFLMTFNDTDKERYPLSDVELGRQLQDEYHETRTNLREHRNRAVPARVAKKSDVTPGDCERINNATVNELILIDGPDVDDKPVQNSIFQLPYAPVDAGLYDVTPIRVDFDQVMGVPDLASGTQQGQRTATAANIQAEGLNDRTSARSEEIEDCISRIANHMLQIALYEMKYEEVLRVAGEGAVWPGMPHPMMNDPMAMMQAIMTTGQIPPHPHQWVNDLTREEIYEMVLVDIQAGSTGKPNKQMVQQQWMQIHPILDQLISQIFELRVSGAHILADAKAELLKELLRRMDEKLDHEKLIPQMPLLPPMIQPQAGGDTGEQSQQPQGLPANNPALIQPQM